MNTRGLNFHGVNTRPLERDLKPMQLHANPTPLPGHCSLLPAWTGFIHGDGPNSDRQIVSHGGGVIIPSLFFFFCFCH